jgi:hypothetical protein
MAIISELCNEAQGYLLGRPDNIESFCELTQESVKARRSASRLCPSFVRRTISWSTSKPGGHGHEVLPVVSDSVLGDGVISRG